MAALRASSGRRRSPSTCSSRPSSRRCCSAYHRTEGAQPHARVELDRKTGHVTVWAAGADDEGGVVARVRRHPGRLRPDRRDDRPAGHPAAAARRRGRAQLRRVPRPRGRHRRRASIQQGADPQDRAGRPRQASRRVLPPQRAGAGRELRARRPAALLRRRGPQGPARARRSRCRAPTPTWCASCSRWRCPRSPTAGRDRRDRPRGRSPHQDRRPVRPCPGVNAKGACIGPMGQRVRAVMSELHGEKIDIVDWSDDPAALRRARAVAGAGRRRSRSSTWPAAPARVVVPDYQLSLAIGKEGQNARLAARLTGWRIDIRPDDAQAAAAGDAADGPAPDGGRTAVTRRARTGGRLAIGRGRRSVAGDPSAQLVRHPRARAGSARAWGAGPGERSVLLRCRGRGRRRSSSSRPAPQRCRGGAPGCTPTRLPRPRRAPSGVPPGPAARRAPLDTAAVREYARAAEHQPTGTVRHGTDRRRRRRKRVRTLMSTR